MKFGSFEYSRCNLILGVYSVSLFLDSVIINKYKYVVNYVPKMFCFYCKDELLNAGVDCWNQCSKKQGPCAFCGTGLCCRKGSEGNGCDGSLGIANAHVCTAAGIYLPHILKPICLYRLNIFILLYWRYYLYYYKLHFIFRHLQAQYFKL